MLTRSRGKAALYPSNLLVEGVGRLVYALLVGNSAFMEAVTAAALEEASAAGLSPAMRISTLGPGSLSQVPTVLGWGG
jgi:hypothetical protein